LLIPSRRLMLSKSKLNPASRPQRLNMLLLLRKVAVKPRTWKPSTLNVVISMSLSVLRYMINWQLVRRILLSAVPLESLFFNNLLM
jgi:hypothetical protein